MIALTPKESANLRNALRVLQYASDDAIEAVPQHLWTGCASLIGKEFDALDRRLNPTHPFNPGSSAPEMCAHNGCGLTATAEVHDWLRIYEVPLAI